MAGGPVWHVLVSSLVLAAVCAVAVDPEQQGALLSEDAGYSLLQEAVLQPEDHKDVPEQNEDAQENQAEEGKEDNSEVEQVNEEEQSAEKAAEEDADMPEEPGLDEHDEQKVDAEVETQSKEDAEQEAHEHSEDVATVPHEHDDADEDEDKHTTAADLTAPKDAHIPIWKRNFKVQESEKLSPEIARQQIEHYTNQAKYTMEAAPEEKRQKVAAKMAAAVTQTTMSEAKMHTDDIDRRQAEDEFKAEGLDAKVAKVNSKTEAVERKMKRTAKGMRKAWKDEQAKVAELKQDAHNTQVNMIEHQRNKYIEWKENKQVEVSQGIDEFKKQAEKFRALAAQETARYNQVHVKVLKKKKMLARLSAEEVKGKKEAIKVKEQRDKIKEKKDKVDQKLQAEKTKEKIVKTTSEVKKKKAEALASPETKKAMDALGKVEGTIKHLQTDVAADMAQTSEDAVLAQKEMLEERKRAEARNNQTKYQPYNFTWNDTYVDPTRNKKCGPRVLCTLYNRVVKAVGGFTKYLKLDMEEREKLGADPKKGEASEEIQRQAFDNIASRFGITGERTEGVYHLPGIKTEWYDRLVKAGGGAAAVTKMIADDEAKLVKQENDERKKAGKGPLKKTPESIKKQAFERVADMQGVSEDGDENKPIDPEDTKAEGGDEPDLV